jgi:hypothetical protein
LNISAENVGYWHKTKCHSSLDSALHKIAWYDPESLATKKTNVGQNCICKARVMSWHETGYIPTKRRKVTSAKEHF